jgi:hypothetical protein
MSTASKHLKPKTLPSSTHQADPIRNRTRWRVPKMSDSISFQRRSGNICPEANGQREGVDDTFLAQLQTSHAATSSVVSATDRNALLSAN